MQLLTLLLQTRALAPLLGPERRHPAPAPYAQAVAPVRTSAPAMAAAGAGADGGLSGRTAPTRDRVEITAAALRLLSGASESGRAASRPSPSAAATASPAPGPAETPATPPATPPNVPAPGVPEPTRAGAPAAPAPPAPADAEEATAPGTSAGDSPASPTSPPFQIGLCASAPWRRHPWLAWAAIAAVTFAALLR